MILILVSRPLRAWKVIARRRDGRVLRGRAAHRTAEGPTSSSIIHPTSIWLEIILCCRRRRRRGHLCYPATSPGADTPIDASPEFLLAFYTCRCDKCATERILRRASGRETVADRGSATASGAWCLAVLDAWGVDSAEPLAGGQGTAFAADDVVFKPVTDEYEAVWLAELLSSLPEPSKFRLIRPARSPGGRWVVDGWSAWQRLDGSAVVGDWRRALEVSRHFHEHVAGVQRPDLSARTHPWAVGDRYAWGEEVFEVPVELRELPRGSKQGSTPSRWRINWCTATFSTTFSSVITYRPR